MEELTAGRAIVEMWQAEGVRHVFGLPGGHVISIYDALYDTPEIRHVLVRHEHAAAAMAAGYAQLTGEPGVCVVTAGPGATNLATAIAEAYVGSLPVIAIAGRGATANAHRGAAQELPTERLFAPITKWSVRVDRADLVWEVVHEGFTVARNGKPGPVYIDIPRDLLDTQIERRPYRPAGPPARPGPGIGGVEDAAVLLTGAERPLIIAGGGVVASGAWRELGYVAQQLGAPVITTLAGRGSIPDDHPLSVGGLGAHRNRLSKRLLSEADVVLGLGCRFEEMETNWRPGFVPSPEALYIQVDIDAAEIGRSVPAHLGIVGDIRSVLGSLVGALNQREFTAHDVDFATEIAEIDAELDELAASEQRPIHPLRVIRAVREVFPRESTVAIDVGAITQHIAGGHPFFRVFEPRSLIVPSSFYGMGFAAAALPAARLARPEAPAVGFVGDGSFQMVMNVLPVAAENELPVTWCIFDDHALGSIWDIQEHRLGKRYLGTEFTVQPKFAAIAEACGCYGERVEDPAEVIPALRRALAANGNGTPAVLDFHVARERLLQTFEHFGFFPQEVTDA
jgi:acetolactate synthase-1/2/3 large subunit